MGYEPKDLPTFKSFDKQIPPLDLILKINKFFTVFGVGSKERLSAKEQFDGMVQSKNELIDTATKFNRYFSHDGWIIYDSMNFEVVKKAVSIYEEKGFEDAKIIIMDAYSPEKIEDRLIFLKHIPQFIPRFKFIEYAFEDYKAERYYSCIPLLIMMIDGLVSDVNQKGFHAQNVDLNVWDSLTSTDTGIEVIKDIFQISRNKTRVEELSLPYRNGVLHGRELAYDNYEVAAKCWAFLFAICDWVLSKVSEDDRKKKFEDDNKEVSWKELFAQRKKIEEEKKHLANWRKLDISKGYISGINIDGKIDEGSPEVMVLEFLNHWKKKNYGKMAQLFSAQMTDDYSKFAGIIRTQCNFRSLKSFRFVSIEDVAASITQVNVVVKFEISKVEEANVEFRCMYEKGKNEVVIRSLGTGAWKISLCWL